MLNPVRSDIIILFSFFFNGTVHRTFRKNGNEKSLCWVLYLMHQAFMSLVWQSEKMELILKEEINTSILFIGPKWVKICNLVQRMWFRMQLFYKPLDVLLLYWGRFAHHDISLVQNNWTLNIKYHQIDCHWNALSFSPNLNFTRIKQKI